ncbi:MAG: DUF2240 family protein [Candidatus Diapherotrites archaeon]|nr:DUF2240 family protein [Candidatus Diapherotrites archaeon]
MVANVLDSKDEIIAKILEAGMTREELEARIKEKQEEYGGLLTEAGAAYSVAKDMGIDLGLPEERVEILKINQLKKGLDNVNIEGVVTTIFPVREWSKAGKSGKVCNLIIKDETGEIRLVLWNNDCGLVESGKVRRGTVVEVQNGYLKEGNNMLDLNVGMRGRVLVKSTAPVAENLVTLNKLEEGANDVSFFARVVKAWPAREFTTDRGQGKVRNVVITDGTQKTLALWNEHAVTELSVGDVIKVENAYVKKDNQGEAQPNLGWRGRVVARPENAPELPEVEVVRNALSNAKAGEAITARAFIVKAFPPSIMEVCTQCGRSKCDHDAAKKKSLILNAEIDDGTAVLRTVFFRDLAEKLVGFTGEDYDQELFDEAKLLGTELVIDGRVQHNDVMDRDEIIVNSYSESDVTKEIEVLTA